MDQKWDFMKQVIGQLECVVTSYDAFCDVAGCLERQELNIWYGYYWGEHPFRVHLNAVEFPDGYIVLRNIAEAYVWAVLTDTAFYKEWYLWRYDVRWRECDRDFLALSREDRKKYLTNCKALYERIAVIEEAQFVIRDWNFFASEIEYLAGVDHIEAIMKTSPGLVHFTNAKILEIRGCEGGFDVYMAMSRNRLLLGTCGCWD